MAGAFSNFVLLERTRRVTLDVEIDTDTDSGSYTPDIKTMEESNHSLISEGNRFREFRGPRNRAYIRGAYGGAGEFSDHWAMRNEHRPERTH